MELNNCENKNHYQQTQKKMKTLKTLLSVIILCSLISSCKKTETTTPELVCSLMSLDDGSGSGTIKFTYDASGKFLTGEIDGIPVKFDYTGNNISKVTYSNANAARTITVGYNAQNRPVTAKKVYASKDFNFTSDYTVTYDANGRLSTLKDDTKGDYSSILIHRLEYDSQGNVVKQFVKEDASPEFVWVENTGFDGKKNQYKGIKFNPLILFYEPLGLFGNQSQSNATVVKSRVVNFDAVGGLYNVDRKSVFTTYNENGYPTAYTEDYTIEHIDFNDPTSTKTVKETGTSKWKNTYSCK